MLSSTFTLLQSIATPLLIGVALAGAALACRMAWRRRPPTESGARRTAGPAVPVDEPAAEGESDSDFNAAPSTVQVRAPAPPADPVLPLAADLLLVDDSAVARAMLRRLFEAAGYRVQLARDGLEALALLERGRYSLMITDLEMPRLDGVALIGACQQRPQTAAMPILAITGHDDLQARLDECRAICGIYRKPWIDDDLSSHVALLVSTRSARSPEPVDA